MSRPTIERAFEIARSGEASDLAALKRRLKAEGCRAVDALLAPRAMSSHLAAICSATFRSDGVNPGAPNETADHELA